MRDFNLKCNLWGKESVHQIKEDLLSSNLKAMEIEKKELMEHNKLVVFQFDLKSDKPFIALIFKE